MMFNIYQHILNITLEHSVSNLQIINFLSKTLEMGVFYTIDMNVYEKSNDISYLYKRREIKMYEFCQEGW